MLGYTYSWALPTLDINFCWGYSRLCALTTSFDFLYLDWCLLSAVQPNKVYIGGLPEHTRQEDLQSCFGKIGNIVNIELKYVFIRPLSYISLPA